MKRVWTILPAIVPPMAVPAIAAQAAGGTAGTGLSVPEIINGAEEQLPEEEAAAEAEDQAIQEALENLAAEDVDPLFEATGETSDDSTGTPTTPPGTFTLDGLENQDVRDMDGGSAKTPGDNAIENAVSTSVLSVTDGTVETTGSVGIRNKKGTVTVSGGQVSGTNGIGNNGGTVTVEGGNAQITGTLYGIWPNASTAVITIRNSFQLMATGTSPYALCNDNSTVTVPDGSSITVEQTST